MSSDTQLKPFSITHNYVGGSAFEDVGSEWVLAPSSWTQLAFELKNTGPAALADFALLIKPHANSAAYQTLISGATWGTVSGILKKYLGALNTLAASGTGFGYVDIGPIAKFKFQAKTATTTLITNGSFTGSSANWTEGAGVAYNANTEVFTNCSATLNQPKANLVAPWVDTQYYQVVFTISGYTGGTLTVGTNTDPAQNYGSGNGGSTDITANGTYSIIVKADAHADGLVFTGTAFTGVMDSVDMYATTNVSILGNLSR